MLCPCRPYKSLHNIELLSLSVHAGETDPSVKSVDPIKVYSEKELIREVEKIASTLVPEKDWSIRIAAMQRIEGLVYGGIFTLPSPTIIFIAYLQKHRDYVW